MSCYYFPSEINHFGLVSKYEPWKCLECERIDSKWDSPKVRFVRKLWKMEGGTGEHLLVFCLASRSAAFDDIRANVPLL